MECVLFYTCLKILMSYYYAEDGPLISFQLLLQCITVSLPGIKIGAPLYGAEIKW